MTTNNHPAHDPVSLDRLHQIREILSKAAAQSDGGNLGYAMADAVKAIDEVLAARKAGQEPVAWVRYCSDGTIDGPLLNYQIDDCRKSTWTPLYAAPQLPQPAKSLELAGWQFKSVNGGWLGLIDEHGKNQAVREGCEVREVFAIADSVNDREQVRRVHAKWSQDTFGNVGPVGPLKHLSKEALEAAAEPGDLSEWADMQFLLWDAQRRAGISDEQITQAMVEKLAVNKQREWPEPKDGEPRLHIKAPPAPGVPVAMKEHQIRELVNELRDIAVEHHGTQSLRERIARAVRAAMLQAGNSPVTPDGWIPVSERMPGSQEWVIVFAKWANQQVLCWDDVANRWTDFEDQSYYADMFTHWMPLPAAPQHRSRRNDGR